MKNCLQNGHRLSLAAGVLAGFESDPGAGSDSGESAISSAV